MELGAAVCGACLSPVDERPEPKRHHRAEVKAIEEARALSPAEQSELGAACPDHPELPAAGTCSRCGRFVCVRCAPDVLTSRSVQCPACVAREEAAAPVGIGGWLVLPAINVVLQPLLALPFAGLLVVLASPHERGHAGLPAAFAFALYGLFALVVAVFFFGKRRLAPVLYIIMVLINVAVAVLGTSSLATSSDSVLRAVVGAAIWIPYFLLSKRVKATFVH